MLQVRVGAGRHRAHHGRIDLTARARHGHVSAELLGHSAAGCALLSSIGRHAGTHGMAATAWCPMAAGCPVKFGPILAAIISEIVGRLSTAWMSTVALRLYRMRMRQS